jgi:hypothetical protein
MALGAGSPAIDAVPAASCATNVDQRGVPRPLDGDGDAIADCDIGAFEAFIDADGDGSPADLDCDDSNPDRFPGNPEVCDNIDNDCDDVIDQFATTCGLGACAGTGFCMNGVDDCVLAMDPPEACGGTDTDCDGVIDDCIDKVFLPPLGTLGLGDGEIGYGQDTAVDSQGNVYVTEARRGGIQVFDQDSRWTGRSRLASTSTRWTTCTCRSPTWC